MMVGVSLCVSHAAAVGARAAVLSIVPDKTTYAVGETVVVQLVGDPQGASDVGIFARLRFTAATLTGGGVVSLAPTSSSGALPWVEGSHDCAAGYCDMLNAIGGPVPLPVDQIGSQVWATATLQAAKRGTVMLTLETLGPQLSGYEFDFFGLTGIPGVPIQIVGPPVPAVDRLGLGLLAGLLAASAAWWLRALARGARAPARTR